MLHRLYAHCLAQAQLQPATKVLRMLKAHVLLAAVSWQHTMHPQQQKLDVSGQLSQTCRAHRWTLCLSKSHQLLHQHPVPAGSRQQRSGLQQQQQEE